MKPTIRQIPFDVYLPAAADKGKVMASLGGETVA